MEIIDRNKALMKKFEKMINNADEKLAQELIADEASFFTPASPSSLYGGSGYLSVVHWMRKGFSDVKWTIEDMAQKGIKLQLCGR